jgi:PBP1b-binding outer membrane lipoprotein LpoB
MINKKGINKMIALIIAALVGCAAQEATETKPAETTTVTEPVVESAPAQPEVVAVPSTEATPVTPQVTEPATNTTTGASK